MGEPAERGLFPNRSFDNKHKLFGPEKTLKLYENSIHVCAYVTWTALFSKIELPDKKRKEKKKKKGGREIALGEGNQKKKKRAVAADKSVRDRRVTSGLLPAVPQSRLRVRDQLTVTSCTKTAGRAEGGGLNT